MDVSWIVAVLNMVVYAKMEITLQVNRDGFLNLESAQSLGKRNRSREIMAQNYSGWGGGGQQVWGEVLSYETAQ